MWTFTQLPADQPFQLMRRLIVTIKSKMCSRPDRQTQTRSAIVRWCMFVWQRSVYSFGLGLWSGRASGSNRRIPGSRTLEVLLTHGDLIAPLLKTSSAASRDTRCVWGRKCSMFWYKFERYKIYISFLSRKSKTITQLQLCLKVPCYTYFRSLLFTPGSSRAASQDESSKETLQIFRKLQI